MDTTKDDLAGRYLHDYAAGEIGYQGRVLGLKGQKVLVQLYSWLTGQPADVVSFTKAFVTKKCRLYTDRETWATEGVAAKAASRNWRQWRPPTQRPVPGSSRQEKKSSSTADVSIFE